MKTKHTICALFTLGIFSLGLSATAAPSLPITKAPVTPNPSFTGPNIDPHAISGQWFSDLSASNLESRTHQFHDNTTGTGGGSMGHLAIMGYVTNATFNILFGQTNSMASFEIFAIIANDAPSVSGMWTDGTNSHNESLSTQQKYTNALVSTVLTANFAATDLLPENFVIPYRFTSPNIIASTPNYLAWYCWNTNKLNETQYGGFYVPGWNFGTIEPGNSSTNILAFVIQGFGLSTEDPRYATIMDSLTNGTDIFISRSLSLKIASWIADPVQDDGSAYPVDGQSGADLGNVSVFHNVIAGALDTPITITSIQWQQSASTFYINSVGASGTVQQILQSTTNLTITNWADIVTNPTPSHYTNYWTNSSVTAPLRFYRIVQP